ncbi:MAG TPA: hypothetical protein VJL32_00625 [Candidatus Paceibacterota bacterium]
MSVERSPMDQSQPTAPDRIIFPVETIRSPEGNSISVSPERGGIITSLVLGGKELLYMDPNTFNNPDVNVKGGIPILFPNAGPLRLPEGHPLAKLKQHGFARNSNRWQFTPNPDGSGFRESLTDQPASLQIFPYGFRLDIEGKFTEGGGFELIPRATNSERDRSMPVSFGLHPYFRVPHDQKHKIKFDFPGGENISPEPPAENPNVASKIDNPQVRNPETPLRVIIPQLGTLVMDISPIYRRIWVWSVPGSDFICIEPVMRDPGGLVDDPEMVPPEQSVSGRVNIRLEPEL